MHRRKLLGLAVALAALATSAAPAAATPVHPDGHSSHLTMPGSSTWGNLTAADASAAASFKSFGGLDSETDFMDYTDDVV